MRVAACLTLGSALRQLGRHEEAERCDRRAKRFAQDNAQRAHALASLVADVVLTDARAAAKRLDDARAVSTRDPRARIRVLWVGAEHALVTRRPDEAATLCRRALAIARASRFKRHEAKTLLFLGAALNDAGAAGEAARALTASARIAERIGAQLVAEASASLLGSIPR
ncbi:MAG: hypothetical protein ABR552_11725 [Actinomycetota bacterium]